MPNPINYFHTDSIAVAAPNPAAILEKVIPNSNWYKSIVLQFVGFDAAMVVDILVSLDGTNFAKIDDVDFNVATDRVWMRTFPSACKGGIKVKSQGNQTVSGTILVSMTDTHHNFARTLST